MTKEEILKAISLELYVDYENNGNNDRCVGIELEHLAIFIENLFLKQKLKALETKI